MCVLLEKVNSYSCNLNRNNWSDGWIEKEKKVIVDTKFHEFKSLSFTQFLDLSYYLHYWNKCTDRITWPKQNELREKKDAYILGIWVGSAFYSVIDASKQFRHEGYGSSVSQQVTNGWMDGRMNGWMDAKSFHYFLLVLCYMGMRDILEFVGACYILSTRQQ